MLKKITNDWSKNKKKQLTVVNLLHQQENIVIRQKEQ